MNRTKLDRYNFSYKVNSFPQIITLSILREKYMHNLYFKNRKFWKTTIYYNFSSDYNYDMHFKIFFNLSFANFIQAYNAYSPPTSLLQVVLGLPHLPLDFRSFLFFILFIYLFCFICDNPLNPISAAHIQMNVCPLEHGQSMRYHTSKETDFPSPSCGQISIFINTLSP